MLLLLLMEGKVEIAIAQINISATVKYLKESPELVNLEKKVSDSGPRFTQPVS